jgi:hypothetical protein
VIGQLAGVAGQPASGSAGTQGYGPVLSDEQAFNLFSGYCAQPWGGELLLYALYVRAAQFAGSIPEAP